MKKEKTIRDITYDELTEKQRESIWKLIDGWYQNTDLWDLLEMSGIIDTPLSELDEVELEREEYSCMKCGKIISDGEATDYGYMCATCWHERN